MLRFQLAIAAYSRICPGREEARRDDLRPGSSGAFRMVGEAHRRYPSSAKGGRSCAMKKFPARELADPRRTVPPLRLRPISLGGSRSDRDELEKESRSICHGGVPRQSGWMQKPFGALWSREQKKIPSPYLRPLAARAPFVGGVRSIPPPLPTRTKFCWPRSITRKGRRSAARLPALAGFISSPGEERHLQHVRRSSVLSDPSFDSPTKLITEIRALLARPTATGAPADRPPQPRPPKQRMVRSTVSPRRHRALECGHFAEPSPALASFSRSPDRLLFRSAGLS